MTTKTIKKVTKDYKIITKQTLKDAKSILLDIVNYNKNNGKINQNGDFIGKISITADQKNKIKTLASSILIDSIIAKYDNLTNKQLALAVRNATHGAYTRIEWNKTQTTYDYDADKISVMDFFRNIGWAILGRQVVAR